MKDVFNSIFNGTLIEVKFVNEGILNCKFFLSEQDKKDRKFMFELDLIDTTINNKEFIRSLSITHGDIVWACEGTVKTCIIVRNFDVCNIQKYVKIIEKLLEYNELTTSDVPIFFVLEKSKHDIFYTQITRLLKEGYVDANALVDFESYSVMDKTTKRFVMVKTTKRVLESMYRHVYIQKYFK